MSSYNHTIGFKVLIESEVVDFTFRVPRGTLLIQLLDELETTLRIHPRIIAIINNLGEVVVIKNHYSPIDYLVQKFGTEFYSGEASFITFNQGEYIIDLEVPEAIPFAATFRTACRSFSVKTREVGIERQDGQIMDYEVFSMPTAFVLNSWGNYYRIVDKEQGDAFVEPIGIPIHKTPPEPPMQHSTQMVYPPKLDGSDIIDVAKKLVEATPVDDLEVDQITQHFVETSFPRDRILTKPQITPKSEPKEEEDIADFLTVPIDEKEIKEEKEEERVIYPWEKEELIEEIKMDIDEEDLSKETQFEESLESLMDEIIIDDEIEVEEINSAEVELSEEELTKIKHILTESEELSSEESSISEEYTPTDNISVEEVFKEILVDEEKERFIREGPLDQVEPDADIEFDDEEEALGDTSFYDDEEDEQIDEESEEELEEELYDFPLINEDEESIGVESINELSQTEAVTPIAEVPLEEILSHIDDSLSLEERLEIRKIELDKLAIDYKAEEKYTDPELQRIISIDYYQRMYPQKIYPLRVKIPIVSQSNLKNNNKLNEYKLQPILPGCYITPQEEIINLSNDKTTLSEFNVTPLIRRGKIIGKIGIIQDHKNLISINIHSKVVGTFWPIFLIVLAVFFGGLPLILDSIISFNTLFSNAINNILSPNVLMWIELGLLLFLLMIAIALIIGLRPIKKTITKKLNLNNHKNGE
ncbi:MAG: hypothetical protein JXA54_09960 [Candidatus Heimdallarchaeota archaeon]|nr:hypothetical protein [Candidatus Heimdallarchaeota archaeon]